MIKGATARRAAIEALIQETPGLSFREIASRTGLARGSAKHHVDALHKVGRVWSHPFQGRRAHFLGVKPQTIQGVQAALLSALDDVDSHLWRVASRRGPVCQKDLIQGAPGQLSRSTVQNRVKRLVHSGLLTESPSGRRMHYCVVGAS